MTHRFTKLLEEQPAVLFDGGMGTYLYQKGVFLNRCFDELNVTAGDLVSSVHEEYVRAGADVIETNTFGANVVKLTPHGLGDRVAELNIAGVRAARKAAGDRALVAGAIGPLGVQIEPWGPTALEEARDAFRGQAEALAEGGVDLFLLETFGNLSEIQQALRAVREVSDLPVIAQMTIDAEGDSLYGTTTEVFTQRLDEWGADVIGLNCSVGPKAMLDALERMARVTRRPLSAQPNAGVPRAVEGRNIYLVSPEYLAEYARRFVQAGARVVGGCCGTTPTHIRAMRQTLRLLAADATRAAGPRVTAGDTTRLDAAASEPVPLGQRSRFAAKIAAGEFVTSVEISPPRGHDASRIIKSAKLLKSAGVDAVNVPDGPRATARMGALATAVCIERDSGIETVLHYACRDRNLLGIQSDLLGADALGLRNLLLVTGDPPKLGDYPDATAVFDVDAIGLTNIVWRLNHGLDIGGASIGEPTRFCFGVGVNPGAVDLAHELKRFRYKVEAGAEFAITQPVFDVALLERFLEMIEEIRIPVIAGIWPLLSFRNAEFMNNEVPGAHVPDPLLERMKAADEAGGGREEGLAIARETFERVRPLIQGVQVSAPMGKVKLAVKVFGDVLADGDDEA